MPTLRIRTYNFNENVYEINTRINYVNQIIVCDEECIPSTQDLPSTTSNQESYVGLLMLVLEMIDIYGCVFICRLRLQYINLIVLRMRRNDKVLSEAEC